MILHAVSTQDPIPSHPIPSLINRRIAQKRLRDLKSRISAQSKKNFILERDVRYLDSRIALLIHDRIASSLSSEALSHLDPLPTDLDTRLPHTPDARKTQAYANLFFLLQAEPRHVAGLVRMVALGEIDTLLQTVMFTLYGNQYESREEHLLLTMFQVRLDGGLLLFFSSRRLIIRSSVRSSVRPSARSPAVRPLRPIRNNTRLWIPPPRKHPRLPDDDHLHPSRTGPGVPEAGLGAESGCVD